VDEEYDEGGEKPPANVAVEADEMDDCDEIRLMSTGSDPLPPITFVDGDEMESTPIAADMDDATDDDLRRFMRSAGLLIILIG
jgi:hypothetical protein